MSNNVDEELIRHYNVAVVVVGITTTVTHLFLRVTYGPRRGQYECCEILHSRP